MKEKPQKKPEQEPVYFTPPKMTEALQEELMNQVILVNPDLMDINESNTPRFMSELMRISVNYGYMHGVQNFEDYINSQEKQGTPVRRVRQVDTRVNSNATLPNEPTRRKKKK